MSTSLNNTDKGIPNKHRDNYDKKDVESESPEELQLQNAIAIAGMFFDRNMMLDVSLSFLHSEFLSLTTFLPCIVHRRTFTLHFIQTRTVVVEQPICIQ